MNTNKIKMIVPVCISMACMTALGVGMTRTERMARQTKKYAMMEQHVGGALARPGSQQGEVFYVNCQKRIPESWIKESIEYFKFETGFKISLKEGSFQFPNPTIAGNATLFIVDDDALPPLLVAPESRWAMVNMAVVAKEKRPAFFEARAKKEMTRGFAYLCGASESQYQRSLTRGIVDQSALDENPDYDLPVDVYKRFKSYMGPFGVKPLVVVSYKQACQEGWAPAPTNDVQRKVWKEVHELPSEPLKLTK